MGTQTLVWVRPSKPGRSNRYNTRRLTAGDEFDANDKDVKWLIAAKLAKMPHGQEAPPELVAETLQSLRERAAALGIEVDGRWGMTRLHREIIKAKG